MSRSNCLSAILSWPLRPNARAISRFPAGWSELSMKSRICWRVGSPGVFFLAIYPISTFVTPATRSFCRRRCPGLERATRHGGCNRALIAVRRNRRDAEHPIVDTNALQRMIGGCAWETQAVLPIGGIGRTPADDIGGRVRHRFPADGGVARNSAFRRPTRRHRRAREGGEGGDVQLRHLGEIGEIHLVDRVAIFDAIVGPQILGLVFIILARDGEPNRWLTSIGRAPV